MASSKTKVILHSFWASSCSWRVRAALCLKDVAHEEKPLDIAVSKDHLTDGYRRISPSQKVPALEIDGITMVESMAILQYLEDTRPKPPLVPTDPVLKARMREICEVIVSGIQPLQNIGLKQVLTDEAEYNRFSRHYTIRGLETLEDMLKKVSNGRYCVGPRISQADLCLVPQIFNAAGRLRIDVTKYATANKVYNSLLAEDVFIRTHPRNFKPETL